MCGGDLINGVFLTGSILDFWLIMGVTVLQMTTLLIHFKQVVCLSVKIVCKSLKVCLLIVV